MIDLRHGDCLEVMRTLADNSVDSVVTDPPYGIRFMGKAWDGQDIERRAAERRAAASSDPQATDMGGHKSIAAEAGKYDLTPAAMLAFQEFSEHWAREAFRVLKPGGYLLTFASTRTYHRMTCGVEAAGFEIRDQIGWVFSSGFPKSHNLDRERGNAICGCEPTTKHDVRDLRSADVPKAKHAGEGSSEVLQQGLPESGLHSAMPRQESSQGLAGGIQPSLEGWGDDVQEEGQLQGHPLSARAGMDEADGAQGRLHHGAPDGDGRVVRISSDADGSGASRQPRPDAEQQTESGAVAGQPESQTGGAWPVCGGCGKPMAPKGLGTALKPAWEPICVARKPLTGTVVANVLQHGTGALNIDGCRIQTAEALRAGAGGIPCRHDEHTPRGRADEPSANSRYASEGGTDFAMTPGPRGGDAKGRWPANLIHDGGDEVVALFPQSAGQSGAVTGDEPTGNGFSGVVYGHGGVSKRPPATPRNDTGSAARFFYCAKADRADRNEGLYGFDAQQQDAGRKPGKPGGDNPRNRGVHERQNHHPTVKPTDLMRYLCRLVTPAGGLVLDPFCGSGSTGRGAVLEGFRFIGIEREAEYIDIARARIDSARRQGHQPDLLEHAA